MNETVFRELLRESFRREYAEFDNAPEHKFTLRHRLSMKKIFAGYERNVRALKKPESVYIPSSETMPHYSIKQRVVIALVVIILMTLLTGWFFPIREIADAQIGWLRSRYDFPSMKMRTALTLDVAGDFGFAMTTLAETEEYKSFLADLVDMNIYSEDEVKTLKLRQHPKKAGESREYSAAGEDPLESYRVYVAELEADVEYYAERDAEFAAEIAEDYLPLPKSFLELLERLFADAPDDGEESQNKHLSEIDKDDRVYLL
ncbi:MAG: hypothetical protein NC299_09460 [Lachnospiraceae bacterium]|nr:hypothetical protein [Ruminococcus sp.]MCM1275581.1 hypothetical protein [Lachnospiraceae bacterium]